MADLLSVTIGGIYKDVTTEISDVIKQLSGVAEGSIVRCPVTLSYAGDSVYNPDSWTLPYEPQITVSGQNTVIRNHILKNTELGTVKELWSADDWEITISGIIIGKDKNKLPQAEINRLRWFLEVRRGIQVDSPYLAMLGIKWLTIERLELPHTSGYNNQLYSYKCYSDKPFEL